MKVAVIGFGRQGKRRAESLSPLVTEPLVLWDKHEIDSPPSYSHSISSRLDDAILSVDAVAICAPSTSHYVLAKQALNAGKHVLIEKPMTLNPSEAGELVRLAESRKLGIHVGLNMRYRDPVLAATRAIGGGAIGKVKLISGSIGHSQFASAIDDPRRTTGGGPLLDSGTHVLDIAVQMLLANNQTVNPSKNVTYYKVINNGWSASVVLLTSDVAVHISASYSDIRKGVGHRLLVIGDQGSVSLRMGDPDDLMTIANTNGVISQSFTFPDKCWELDCNRFLETCHNPTISNARAAADLVSLLS